MLHMVFDVESIGLHGEGYAVGFVVCDSHVTPVAEGLFACAWAVASGTYQNHLWARDHTDSLPMNCASPREVRTKFWEVWRHWNELFGRGEVHLWADCAWPVEAKFLADCVADDPSLREWKGPYPLMDIAPLIYARGKDPTAMIERLKNELPIHNPLNDARQSARILRELLWGDYEKRIKEEVTK